MHPTSHKGPAPHDVKARHVACIPALAPTRGASAPHHRAVVCRQRPLGLAASGRGRRGVPRLRRPGFNMAGFHGAKASSGAHPAQTRARCAGGRPTRVVRFRRRLEEQVFIVPSRSDKHDSRAVDLSRRTDHVVVVARTAGAVVPRPSSPRPSRATRRWFVGRRPCRTTAGARGRGIHHRDARLDARLGSTRSSSHRHSAGPGSPATPARSQKSPPRRAQRRAHRRHTGGTAEPQQPQQRGRPRGCFGRSSCAAARG